MFTALGEFVKSPQIGMDRLGNESLLRGIDLSKVSERAQTIANAAVVPPRRGARRDFAISQSEQILMTDWAEDVALRHVNSIEPGHMDIVLCGLVVNNRFIVSGGKDGQLIVQTLDGERIASLVGH